MRPTKCATLRDPDGLPELQRIGCATRAACLEVAARAEWRGFSCRRCNDYQPQTDHERRTELHDLAGLGIALARDMFGRRGISQCRALLEDRHRCDKGGGHDGQHRSRTRLWDDDSDQRSADR